MRSWLIEFGWCGIGVSRSPMWRARLGLVQVGLYPGSIVARLASVEGLVRKTREWLAGGAA
jgi:hypothetical protein